MVAIVGVAGLALALGPGRAREPGTRRGRTLALALPALAVVVLELVPLTGALALDQSRRAAQRGEDAPAVAAALRAHALEPWALAPLEQLALLDESAGRLGSAQAWIDRARRTDVGDWQVRVIAARIETKRGAVAAARSDLAAARELAPLSPLFARAP